MTYTSPDGGFEPPDEDRRIALMTALNHLDGVNSTALNNGTIRAEIDPTNAEKVLVTVKKIATGLGYSLKTEGRFSIVLNDGIHDYHIFEGSV